METSLFQTFGPYQTAAQNKTLCHVSESEIQDSPGDHFGTSHGFFYAIIFKTLSKESIQLPFMKVQKKCLLLQNWECVQPWKSTHVSNVNLVLVCVHFYIIFQILRSSLTLILFFSSLLCWHQLVPFFSSPHTLPLCCECSALPARPSPAQITAISFLLTIFFLSPPLFSWQNLLITSHLSFPLAALTCQHLLALSALNSVFPFFLATLQYQMQPVHRLQPQTSPCGSTGSYSLCLSSASLKPHAFYALTTQNNSRTACAVFHEWIPLPKLRWHRIEATFQHM